MHPCARCWILAAAFLLLSLQAALGQEAVQITTSRFGLVRQYKIFTGETMVYKLKGQFIYHETQIADLRDSSILFINDAEARLNQVKNIKIRTGNHFVGTLERLTLYGGAGLFGISSFNNGIYGRKPVFDERVSYISGILVATSFLIKELTTKRIRINKRNRLKIYDYSFQDLNSK